MRDHTAAWWIAPGGARGAARLTRAGQSVIVSVPPAFPRSSRFPLRRATRPPPPTHPSSKATRERKAPPPQPAVTQPAPGYRIRDRYELHEIAGRGGMAIVWRATQYGDAGFKRTVAVKQMH